ncbi:MAG TPA: hypothetical protein PK400_10780 [Phycisphaerales bacterium]|nr:hypothetical protein [Phycisphaerales bacterium]HRQ75439.1 hypothetical protein [Phycisphaerales bacterium]
MIFIENVLILFDPANPRRTVCADSAHATTLGLSFIAPYSGNRNEAPKNDAPCRRISILG